MEATKRVTLTLRLDRDVLNQVGMVAGSQNLSKQAYLEEIVRRTVAEHRAALLRAALQEDQRREDIPF